MPSTQFVSLPTAAKLAIKRSGARPTRLLLAVSVQGQSMWLLEQARRSHKSKAIVRDLDGSPLYAVRKRHRISSSAYGLGQQINSNQTPLGLHWVAEKAGAGYPIGTVFKSRQPVGRTWQGQPEGTIVHRILWLSGLEPGRNQGGDVDTFQRYIYIHGFGDETTLGRPNSHGCIHLSAADLMPLFEQVPLGTLVWIAERCTISPPA